MLLLVGATLTACYTPRTSVIPSSSGFTATPRPSTCHVDFFWTPPDRPYVEIAAIESLNTGEYSRFQEVIRERACELGGDAVIVLLPFSAREGIVVKYQQIPHRLPGAGTGG